MTDKWPVESTTPAISSGKYIDLGNLLSLSKYLGQFNHLWCMGVAGPPVSAGRLIHQSIIRPL